MADAPNWRTQIPPGSRHTVVTKIMETLKTQIPNAGPEGLVELNKFAVRFEQEIFNAATSQLDYLGKISLKMLAMETKSQTNGVANSLPLNSGGGSQNPQDPVSHSMQSQLRNPGQLQIPLASESQARQQLLSQNILNNIGNSGIQGPVALSSALPSGANLTQSSMPNAINQGSNMHSRMAQNSSGNLVGQGGLASNMLANSTRKMQGYQLPQQTGSQQQQSQSSQKILHQQQHLLKQKQQLQHLPGNVPSSIMQSRMQQQQPQQQQQNPMQSTKLQSTQQPHMQIGLQPSQSALQQTQPSMMQSSSGLHQNPQSSVAQTTPNVRQQYPQSVLRKPQQQAQRSRHQQAPVLHQQQHLVLPLQQQINVPNLPSRQQNNVSNMQQQQQQHKQGLLEHQNNIANMQQHLLGNNIPLQQQLSQQSNTSGSQKQHQQPMHTVHQQRENMQKQQNAQVSTNLLQIQEQHAQSQPALQQLMLQHPSQTTQMHQKLGLQQQPNSLQTDMQPKIQTSTGSMLNHQSLLDQKPVFHSQRPPPEDSSAIDAAITGNATTTGNVVDVQEEVYQKIKFMREKYLPDLSHMHQKISQKCQQHDSLPQPPKSEQLERLKAFKNSLEKIMGFLNLPKSMMIPSLKDKVASYEKQILCILNWKHSRKPGLPQPQLQQQQHQMHLDNQKQQQLLQHHHQQLLQSTNSPFIVPSPSPLLARSPIPGDPEKQTSGVSSQSNTGNIGHVHNTAYLGEVQSPAIGTPGISASPLIEEFTGPNGNQVTSSTITKPSVTEQPIERLMKAVNSISPKAFSASVSDIGSVISMIDWIAGSAPGNGSKSAVGEDLVAMARCRIQAKNLIQQDGSSARKKMRRHTVAVPLNAMSSAGSMNDNFKQLVSMELSDIESTATTRMKRSRDEAIHVLLEEIGKINQRLIDTVVDISDEDVRSIAATGAAEGTIVKCSYNAVAVSRNLKALYASAQMTPIQPLRLLVPTNYPNCSPILLDRFPVEPSKEHEDLSTKVKSRFGRSLRSLSQPMSLHDMVKTWDVCVRAVISDYACPRGGSFSSRCGAWENCPSAIDLIS
ncbi:mediator of RNA polymerase II transcription subunit 15a-like isoform X2 [Papaver somniferum]|uniref:mediator of RNA polymerase II transcription subunit 15a-like isoform X2 n=1 Tax=Papaver somniferum TaxID=3469 RepID=UPI000E6FAC93|nr:mediator of RNA polymerase II transcription subunit 15a-like isoform X2 [Papaver somniferum]